MPSDLAGLLDHRMMSESSSATATRKEGVDDLSTDHDKAANDNAVHKVIGCVELLEQIVLQLSPTDLLRAQSISRHFKNVIDGSLHAQRALWYRQDKDSIHRHAIKWDLDPWHIHSDAATEGYLEVNPFLSEYDNTAWWELDVRTSICDHITINMSMALQDFVDLHQELTSHPAQSRFDMILFQGLDNSPHRVFLRVRARCFLWKIDYDASEFSNLDLITLRDLADHRRWPGAAKLEEIVKDDARWKQSSRR